MSATPAKPRSRKRVPTPAAVVPDASQTAQPVETMSAADTAEPPLPFYSGHPDEGAAEAATFDAFAAELAAVSQAAQPGKAKAPRSSRKSDPVETMTARQRASASAKLAKVSRKGVSAETKAPAVQPVAPAPAPMGKLYGYARVSSAGQSLDIQRDTLQAAGCDVIREEKISGTSTAGRAELATLLDFIRKGDTLVVTKIDRLARSVGDLAAIVRTLEEKGAALRATDQPVDTSTAAGKAFLGMLGVFAEFETNIRKERQLEGIAKAKVEGVYKGRKQSIDTAAVKALHAQGIGATGIASQLGIGRASVYRLLAEPQLKG